jgi:hypothetical protein
VWWYTISVLSTFIRVAVMSVLLVPVRSRVEASAAYILQSGFLAWPGVLYWSSCTLPVVGLFLTIDHH